MLVNSRSAAVGGERSHHGLRYDVGRFPERAADGHAGAVGHGPLALHGPAVGFPRGQQVLESLQEEGDGTGKRVSADWSPASVLCGHQSTTLSGPPVSSPGRQRR